MAEVGTAAAGAVVAGAGAVSALASEPVCFSLLLALLTTAATVTTTHITMATRLLTAMAMDTVAPTMVMAATTRAIGTQVTPIVVITIDMVATIRTVDTPTVKNRAALDHRRKTAVKAVFLFLPACWESFRRVDVVIE